MDPIAIITRLPGPVLRLLSGRPIEIDGQVMDPKSQMMTRLIALMIKTPIEDQSPQEARRMMERMRERTPGSPIPDVRDRTVQGPAGSIVVRSYVPEGAGSCAPALVYFHGGGWVLGTLGTHDQLCGELARRAGCVVVSVDYRLAPEHPYPAALDDAFAAYRAVIDAAGDFGVDPARVAVGGDSAGGNLAAAMCLRARDDGVALPVAQLLIYPVTDASKESRSYEHFASGFLLTRAGMRYFIGHYLPDRDPRTEPTASPLLAADLTGLPPACMVLAGFDPLRDEGTAYAARLKAAGTEVDTYLYPTTFHGFFGMFDYIPAAGEAMDAAARSLRRRFSRTDG